MSEENEAPPAPPAAEPPPAESDKPVTRAELEQLRDRVDDVEDVAYSTAAVVLEDDEPEKTTVEPRHETPPDGEKTKDEATPPAEQPKRHSGLFS